MLVPVHGTHVRPVTGNGVSYRIRRYAHGMLRPLDHEGGGGVRAPSCRCHGAPGSATVGSGGLIEFPRGR